MWELVSANRLVLADEASPRVFGACVKTCIFSLPRTSRVRLTASSANLAKHSEAGRARKEQDV